MDLLWRYTSPDELFSVVANRAVGAVDMRFVKDDSGFPDAARVVEAHVLASALRNGAWGFRNLYLPVLMPNPSTSLCDYSSSAVRDDPTSGSGRSGGRRKSRRREHS